MKKLFIISLILLFYSNAIHAQNKEQENRHFIHSDVPLEALASVELSNPGLHSSHPLIGQPIHMAPEKQAYTLQKMDFQVLFLGKDFRKKEVYSKQGILCYSKTKTKNKILPRPLYRYIGKEYEGWALKKNEIIKIYKRSYKNPVSLTYYKLVLQKGNKKQRIFLDEHGAVYAGTRY